MVEAKIVKKDYSADFAGSTGNSEIIEKIDQIDPEVLTTENKLFKNFSSIKVKREFNAFGG